MNKRLLLPPGNGRERDIFFVREDRPYLQKHASAYHPKVQHYIQNAKPIEGLIQVLLTALGSWPYWQQNVNGDRFEEKALSHEGEDYGYQTFLSNANYFTHHVNKDPALAKGKVLAAVWNERAKRVELVIGINPLLDPDAAASIENGESLAFSMGCRLPYDICSICANRAKTRLEYCDHLRYQMNQIDPVSGMLVGAINPYPKFFDISRVLIPADKTAYMWEKIASPAASSLSKLGSAELAETSAKNWSDDKWVQAKIAANAEAWAEKKSAKTASVGKQATITKQILLTSANPVLTEYLKKTLPIVKQALDASSPDLDMSLLKGFSLPQIISTLLALGIVPKASESAELFKTFSGESYEGDAPFMAQAFHPMLARRLMPLVPERSFARPVIVNRIIILAAKPESELRKLAEDNSKKSSFHAGLATGILAAALVLSKNPTFLGNLIANHPFFTAILGAGLVRGAREMGKPVVGGEYSLAEPANPSYNYGWQRSFADAQAHPVTVIKTGADKTELFESTYGGMPFLLALEGISQRPESKLFENNPQFFTGSILTKESSAVDAAVSNLINSAKRFSKSASLENIDFLEGVPESSRHLVWDLAILNASDKISRKLR